MAKSREGLGTRLLVHMLYMYMSSACSLIPRLPLLVNKKVMENWAGPGNEASTELLQSMYMYICACNCRLYEIGKLL